MILPPHNPMGTNVSTDASTERSWLVVRASAAVSPDLIAFSRIAEFHSYVDCFTLSREFDVGGASVSCFKDWGQGIITLPFFLCGGCPFFSPIGAPGLSNGRFFVPQLCICITPSNQKFHEKTSEFSVNSIEKWNGITLDHFISVLDA